MRNQAENPTATSQTRIDLRKFIIKWNHNYPIDFIWRKKYGVAFGSQEHRQMSFLDMLFDLEEEVMMNNLLAKNEKEKIKQPEIKEGISDEDFDNLDIDQFNIKKD